MRIQYSFFYGVILIGVIFCAAFLVPQNVQSETVNQGLIVAELFTSQSCSSCPAADKVMQEISQNDKVITLSCHVTYWNHLHWKDTLSQKFCTARQKDYAAHRDTTRVYTPQLVVNGAARFNSYDIWGLRKDADGVVVLAQDTRTGHIHAAGRLRFWD